MRSPAGRTSQVPLPIIAAVRRHVEEFGRDVAGDDVFLLAILDLPDDVVARRVLEAEGLSADRVLAEIRTSEDVPSDSPRGVRFPPAYNEMLGRAQGLAAALGDGQITPEHVLLSLIWNPTSLASQVLWRVGISRERLVDRLREMGVSTPRADLPEQREMEVGERVWFGRHETDRVLRHLREHIPPDVFWGFNYEDDRAWVWAEARIDMHALVAEALAQT
jgi:ATP-dependent Clp protease ATP-binding subunit ClpA